MEAVIAEHISKKYRNQEVLSGIELNIKQGEMFGIIGPDGAGKTTLFRILTTLILPDTGQVFVSGLHAESQYLEIRKRIGYMPGRFSLYLDMTVEENLEFFAKVFHTSVQENDYLIRDIYVQLEPFKKRKAGDLSGGMKQKLALCCALIHRPEVLFLDEPTTGVDPISRKEFWRMLGRLKESGMTIVVSTPYMDEAAQCDRIALIKSGRFLIQDTPKNIVSTFPYDLLAVEGNHPFQLLKDLRKHPLVVHCYAFGDAHHTTIQQDSMTESTLTTYLEQLGHTGVAIQKIEPSIEDCFMQLAMNHE
jgi:ABC-2 type transport system ATP-binding protein